MKKRLSIGLIIVGVLVMIDGSSRSGPAALIAIFVIPIAAVGLLPLVEGLKGFKNEEKYRPIANDCWRARGLEHGWNTFSFF